MGPTSGFEHLKKPASGQILVYLYQSLWIVGKFRVLAQFGRPKEVSSGVQQRLGVKANRGFFIAFCIVEFVKNLLDS